MNFFYRLYCRAFQTAFRLAIPFLPYRDPKVLGSVEEIPAELTKRNISRVLIVSDRKISMLGLLEPLKHALLAAGIEYFLYDRTFENPTVDNVEQARETYLQNRCGGLIGFGGGSAIDCAKAVGARLARPRKPVEKMRGILKVILRIPFLVAVPTTAGTGSEITLAAVITDAYTGYKFPINDFSLIPRVAVLDPKNTATLPKFMTAATGMDALTHAVEAYIGCSTTASTRADALKAVKLIFENLENAYTLGDECARAHMLTAAFLAGRAFSKSYVGYVHAVAHSLGGQYNIPHGFANAVLLPRVLEAYGSAVYKKLHRLAVAAGISQKEQSDSVAALEFISAIRTLNRRMGIQESIPGIRKEDIPELARRASREANPLYPVPVLMDAKELEKFYRDVADSEDAK